MTSIFRRAPFRWNNRFAPGTKSVSPFWLAPCPSSIFLHGLVTGKVVYHCVYCTESARSFLSKKPKKKQTNRTRQCLNCFTLCSVCVFLNAFCTIGSILLTVEENLIQKSTAGSHCSFCAHIRFLRNGKWAPAVLCNVPSFPLHIWVSPTHTHIHTHSCCIARYVWLFFFTVLLRYKLFIYLTKFKKKTY